MMTTVIVAGTGIPGLAWNQLDNPYGIFVDVNLDLYVADFFNHRIQLFPSRQLNGIIVAGKESPYSTISLNRPTGIILDALKYLFIVDQDSHRIVGSSPNGFRCLVGCDRQGLKSHQLNYPFSFSFDRSGNMFVTDQLNNRIQKFIYLEKCCGMLNKMMKCEFRE